MAFNLLNGADCGPSNPLQQALKASAQDASLQRDFHQPIAGSSQGLRSQFNATPEARAEEERFYRGGASPFDMASMRQGLPPQSADDFARFQASFHREQAVADNGWAADFATKSGPPIPRFQELPPTSAVSAPPNGTYAPQPTYSAGGYSSMYRPTSFMPMSGYMSPSYMAQPQHETMGKGKQRADDRFIEITDEKAWDAAFAKMSTPPPVVQASRVEEKEPIVADNQEEDPLTANLDAEWRRMQKDFNSYANMDKEMSEWEAQYGSQFVNQDGDYSYHQTDVFNYQDLVENPPEWDWMNQDEAPLTDQQDPFEEGKRLLAAGAPFSEVERAFEQACKRDMSRAEAWTALGETLAADEKELLAIKALERAISLPGSGSESAWLSLAISYINEGHDTKALGVLEEWLKRTYPQIVRNAPPAVNTETEDGSVNPWANQQRVIDMYLQAARAGPSARTRTLEGATNEQVDADVQIGLGVLFYGNSDYNLAKDCFEAALSVKPEDYILWNRLGATLANGGNPEDAISAYRTALSIRPNFTRSLYNLGVSCLNINCFQEAAEHLLAALELQGNAGKGEESDSLWQTLRRTFVCMERHDLADKARNHAPLDEFRQEFQF